MIDVEVGGHPAGALLDRTWWHLISSLNCLLVIGSFDKFGWLVYENNTNMSIWFQLLKDEDILFFYILNRYIILFYTFVV